MAMDLQQQTPQQAIGEMPPAKKLKTAARILRLDPVENGDLPLQIAAYVGIRISEPTHNSEFYKRKRL